MAIGVDNEGGMNTLLLPGTWHWLHWDMAALMRAAFPLGWGYH